VCGRVVLWARGQQCSGQGVDVRGQPPSHTSWWIGPAIHCDRPAVHRAEMRDCLRSAGESAAAQPSRVLVVLGRQGETSPGKSGKWLGTAEENGRGTANDSIGVKRLDIK